jgi:hypothetical protein
LFDGGLSGIGQLGLDAGLPNDSARGVSRRRAESIGRGFDPDSGTQRTSTTSSSLSRAVESEAALMGATSHIMMIGYTTGPRRSP